MSEENETAYDFEFLTKALNLIPYTDHESCISDGTVSGAFNPASISNLRFNSEGVAIITLFNAEVIMINEKHLAELEATIKRRWAEIQESEAAAIKRRAEMEAQASIAAANQAIGDAAMMAKLKRVH